MQGEAGTGHQPPASSFPGGRAGTLLGDKPSVLVVDDDRNYCDVMCHFLKTVGFESIQADSGRRGLEVLEEREPEAILLDLHMPDIDGFTFYRRCRDAGCG